MIQALVTLVGTGDPCKIQSKRKAITAFLPYAVWKEREGDHRVMDAFLGAVKASNSTASLWPPVTPFISTMFSVASSRAILITSPHISWRREPQNTNMVDRWASAVAEASATPCLDEVEQKIVEQRVVDALLHIASVDTLRPHITRDCWSWLNSRPALCPMSQGRSLAKTRHVVRCVRGLRDPNILTSYLELVWSPWDPIPPSEDFSEMRLTVSRDFRGAGMKNHRERLINHLDHVLKELDKGLGYLKQFKLWIEEREIQVAKLQYGELMEKLLEVDRRVADIPPTCKSSCAERHLLRLLTFVDVLRILRLKFVCVMFAVLWLSSCFFVSSFLDLHILSIISSCIARTVEYAFFSWHTMIHAVVVRCI